MNDGNIIHIFERIEKLRTELFAAIDHSIEMDGHHKSYEGRIGVLWPHRFNDSYTITLDCYVIGPNRHYAWCGDDLSCVLDEAETDIRSWIEEEYDLDAET
jgi:hypothetical protein